ncbi:MAG: inositol monophosphatase family protein [Candidatus Promineifilaceae bacterium]
MNQISENALNELQSVAVQAALEAGALLRRKWHEPRQISEKGFRDLVTDADFASQTLIVEIIQSHFPDHGFLVEEEDSSLAASGPIIWVIDPVDGTTNYSRQIPNFCISIAAMKRPSPEDPSGEPKILVGVIYNPMLDELFRAAVGQGVYLNDTKIQVSDTDDLGHAVIAIDWSHAPDQRQQTLDMIQNIAHHVETLRAVGSAALALAWIAAGRLDGYFNLNLKPWDVAAGKLLISEAGGELVNLKNHPWRLEDHGCFAGNGRVTPELIVKLTLAQ